jgi:hypothetical protein
MRITIPHIVQELLLVVNTNNHHIIYIFNWLQVHGTCNEIDVITIALERKNSYFINVLPRSFLIAIVHYFSVLASLNDQQVITLFTHNLSCRILPQSMKRS